MPANLHLSGGRLVDPLHGDDGRFDLRIADDGTITKLTPDRLREGGLSMCRVPLVPGLIDMHAHHFAGTEPDHYLRNSFHGLPPDGFTLRCGVTTSVDAGSAGWRSFPAFKSQTIDRSITRVLGFLNIVGEGMRGPPLEQDNADMSSEAAAAFAGGNREHVLGFKVAHYRKPDWVPIDNAIAAGDSAQLPVMIDFGRSGLSLEELTMHRLGRGYLYSRFRRRDRGAVDCRSGHRAAPPFVKAARARGIVWDVGH